jgi:hypothetical protein
MEPKQKVSHRSKNVPHALLVKLRQLDRKYVFIALFCVIGSALLFITRAATPVVDFEGEGGTLSGDAEVITDPTASQGRTIQFGTGAIVPPLLTGIWYLAFQDTFDDAQKSLTETWETHPPYTTSYPGSVSVTNGILSLKTGSATNYEWAGVSTSGPRSNTEPNYPRMKAWQGGYFEARLRYTRSEWSWPALWLFSAAKSEAWPGENCAYLDAEWDIMENGVENGWQHRPAGDWFFTNMHRNTSDGTPDGYCGTANEARPFSQNMTGVVDLSDWHIWGGRWIGNQLCAYLDNQQLHCDTAYDSMAQPMELHLDMAFLGGCQSQSWCGPRPTELQMDVDWVRVWQPL